ncbi:protein disulfide isomerase family protein [Pseudanabaena sp. UWO310]|uniref:protein disulfide isomerase family protein n=1 Tax=Pseudanabaena sp. UWO310 TaxID=2480795 RepID=UPI00115BD647|nr:protein disulfide isomerase family protein [Pseudanabaena sp. UWO310]TYQ26417.1 hypothetical protein PseudUWO310_17475 [Pseudanabaena sp. UWO310]
MKFPLASTTLASVGIAIASIAGISALSLSPQLTPIAIAQQAGEPVTTTSSPDAIDLAKHLRKIGAKLYTAFWCPHCHNQKERFGKEAVDELEVIECDERGVNPQTQLCIDKRIRGYPTWEINGKLYPGDRSLKGLAEISKYRSQF